MDAKTKNLARLTSLLGASFAVGGLCGTAASYWAGEPMTVLALPAQLLPDTPAHKIELKNQASPLPFLMSAQLPVLQTQTAQIDPATLSTDEVFQRAFGREAPAMPAGEYPIVLDTREVGFLAVRATGPGNDVTVDTQRISTLIAPLLTEEGAEKLEALVASSGGTVTSAQLRTIGVNLTLDPLLLVVVLEIDPAIRALQDLGVMDVARLDLARAAPNADVSAIMNFQLLQQFRDLNTGFGYQREPLQVQLDGAINLFGVVAEGGAYYDDDANRVIRLPARLTYDIPSEQIRLQAGDISAVGEGFVDNGPMLGASISRQLAMDPYRDSRPRFAQEFLIERDAIVRVLLNGVSVRTLTLPPGRYRLQDLPIALNRESDVVIEVEELGGETRVYNFSTFAVTQLLQAGENDYGLSAGVSRSFDLLGDIEYDEDDWMVTGYYRRGITDTVTLGVNFAAYDTGYLAGGDFIFATDIGAFSGVGAFSDFDVAGQGHAFELTYQWVSDVEQGALSQQVVASLAYRSEDFTPRELPGTLTGPNNTNGLEVTAAYQRDITNDVTLRIAGSYVQQRDETEDFYSFTGGVTWRVDDRLSVFGNVTWRSGQRTVLERDDVAFRVGLTWRPTEDGRFRADYDSDNDTARVSYAQRKPTYAGSLDWSVGAVNRPDGTAFEGDAAFTANRFTVSASHVYDDSDGSQTTRLQAGTALVFADGAVAISRPVPDSFVVVNRTDSVASDELGIDPVSFQVAGESQRFKAYADNLGAGVVPDLNQYQPRNIEILPTGDFETTGARADNKLVFPGYRTGTKITIGDDAVASMIAVVSAGGAPLPLATGTAKPVGGGDALPVFANIAGRIFLDKLVPGTTYEIEVFDQQGRRYVATLAIPEDARGMARDVTIEVSPQ